MGHPLFETERLLLREFTPDDGAVIYRLNLDPLVMRYTGDKPFASVGDASDFLNRYEHYRKYGFGRWAVIRKTDGEFLGWCGLKFDEVCGECDVGFRFFRRFWSRGYATESARECIGFGFGTLMLPLIVARCMPENRASVRVIEKCGMRFRETWLEDAITWNVYELQLADR
jgi:[ribosomal protein S5]-alanine N-acetyltransferase